MRRSRYKCSKVSVLVSLAHKATTELGHLRILFFVLLLTFRIFVCGTLGGGEVPDTHHQQSVPQYISIVKSQRRSKKNKKTNVLRH